MQHSFDIEIAEKYGVSEAILLQHLWFWIEKNKANEVNFYDGTYWTYNSIKALKDHVNTGEYVKSGILKDLRIDTQDLKVQRLEQTCS